MSSFTGDMVGRIARRQPHRARNTTESHITTGGRFAFCPTCGVTEGKHPVFSGELVEFYCEGCELEVVAPAIPTSNKEMVEWMAVGLGHEETDPDAWALVLLRRMEKEGCDHPSTQTIKLGPAKFECGKCGKVWNMDRTAMKELKRRAPITAHLFAQLNVSDSADKKKLVKGLQGLDKSQVDKLAKRLLQSGNYKRRTTQDNE